MAEGRPAQRSRTQQNSEISLGAKRSNDDDDDAVGKYLPGDLVEAVFQRLPLVSICRFRAVSKQWNSLLTSSSFCQKFSGVPLIYAAILRKANSGVLYDPVEGKWYRCVIPHLRGKDAHPLASAGSLICLWDTNDRRLCVANPLKNSIRPLPRTPGLFWPTMKVGMTLNEQNEGSGYKIVSLNTSGTYAVYDSLQNNWIHRGRVPSNFLPFSLVSESKTVSIGSVVYFLRKQPGGLLCYNMANGLWDQLVYLLPDSLAGCLLAEGEGKLLLLRIISGRVCCLRTFELDNLGGWTLVNKTSANFCGGFFRSDIRMDCVINQKQIMVVQSSAEYARIFTYDVRREKWVRHNSLPPGMERITRQHKVLLGALFNPSFSASA